MVFETLNVRKEGAVLFAEIAAPPMNLLGPELVRDLVSLIQRAEADDVIQVLVFTSADPDYFISHVDVTRIDEYRAGGGEADGRSVDRAPVSPSERKPPRHHRADRGPRTQRAAASSRWLATCALPRESRRSSVSSSLRSV